MRDKNFKIKIFADGADLESIFKLDRNPIIDGFTTNPTLMRMAGVDDYEAFAKSVLERITLKPVSFEVFADDLFEMERQAKIISSWGRNVNVKIPITNTKGEFTGPVIKKLGDLGISTNVTAILELQQIEAIAECINPDVDTIVSIFAGRIADTGRDPIPYIKKSKKILSTFPRCEVLWASTREVFNIYQAEDCGCDIITVPDVILSKIDLKNKDLSELSLETVQMFYNDAQKSKYCIN